MGGSYPGTRRTRKPESGNESGIARELRMRIVFQKTESVFWVSESDERGGDAAASESDGVDSARQEAAKTRRKRVAFARVHDSRI
jgi:hypothetical protein